MTIIKILLAGLSLKAVRIFHERFPLVEELRFCMAALVQNSTYIYRMDDANGRKSFSVDSSVNNIGGLLQENIEVSMRS